MKNPKLYHYLVTLETVGPLRLHAYVVTHRKSELQRIINYLVDQAEAHHIPLLGIVLMTPLTTGVEIVRRILVENSPRIEETLAESKDFHLSLFAIEKDCQDDRQLLELH